jgi:hypothetical protein
MKLPRIQCDPCLFVAGWAIWSIINGTSFLMPGDMFAYSPSYKILTELGVPDHTCGYIAVGDALLLIMCVPFWSQAFRAGVGIVSAALWVMFGALVTLGGLRAHVLSPNGVWDVAGGCILALSPTMWLLPKHHGAAQ